MGPIGSPETSMLNYVKLRNIPEGYIIQVDRNESVCSRKLTLNAWVDIDVSKEYFAFSFSVEMCKLSENIVRRHMQLAVISLSIVFHLHHTTPFAPSVNIIRS
jgi:hypothetical protein